MKLTVKKTAKIEKKVDGTNRIIYQCSLEGTEFVNTGVMNEEGEPINRVVFGKLTLESVSPNALNKIVQQMIDAEVNINFSRSQTTLGSFSEIKVMPLARGD